MDRIMRHIRYVVGIIRTSQDHQSHRVVSSQVTTLLNGRIMVRRQVGEATMLVFESAYT